MTYLWNAVEVQEATRGDYRGNSDWRADYVSIDSRSVSRGDLFIALIGDNSDGHDYLDQVISNGAVAAIVNYVPENIPEDFPLIIVPDSFEAMYDLARYSRERMSGKIIAVTGSVGKTSVKEMLKTVLSDQGKVYATEGNLNNHYGLPLSLCRMSSDCDYGVFEMGMSSAGEISPLSVLTQPDVAIISTVEAVHIEFFESVEFIADAKAEIFDGIKHGGFVVLNRDNPHYLRLENSARSLNINNIISFGSDSSSDFKLLNYNEKISGSEIIVSYNGKEIKYTLGILGIHQAYNSLSVLAGISAIGADIEKAAKSFSSISAPKGRGKIYQTTINNSDITLIDDSYNSSPVSVATGITHLNNFKNNVGYIRSIAVLGDMYELGKDSKSLHEGLLKTIIENNIDGVITVGDLMKDLFNILPEEKRIRHFDNSVLTSKDIKDLLNSGDIVLVKGSRGIKTDIIVDEILKG